MSLPPEQIRLKRKATDTAPETLYLESDGPKRVRRSSDFVFQLVKSTAQNTQNPFPFRSVRAPRQSSTRIVNGYTGPTVPVVRATAPGAEFEDERRRRAKLGDQTKEIGAKESATSDSQHGLPEPELQATEQPLPRRFHLTRPKNLQPVPTQSQKGGHRRDGSRIDLALFVERPPSTPITSKPPTTEPTAPAAEGDESKEIAPSTPRKKRPKANAAEKKFLAGQKQVQAGIVERNLVDSPEPKKADRNIPSGELSRRAQEILLDMAREYESLEDFSDLKNALDETAMDIDSPDDYVYETYVRVPRSEIANMRDPNDLAKTIGILVIEEEDQQLWETYAEVDEEPDWDPEDEDSNAEDNPANEYPEEELDSDDEYGYGAYRNRHAASDDEEYDLERDAWSD